MVCIDCNLHGRRIHPLQKGTKDEYVFVTSSPQVFPKTCQKCNDTDCPYNFNMKKLLKNKKLRKKVLDYVFDATFDDMLLEYGIVPIRDTPVLREMIDETEVYSKPIYNKKHGKKLLKIDKIINTCRDYYIKSVDVLINLEKIIPSAPKKIIIERKDRKKVRK